jgi:surface polysaccharide O-acyltransferase-like enzyme
MELNDNKSKHTNLFRKIGICLLVLTVILYYVLSIQFLASSEIN